MTAERVTEFLALYNSLDARLRKRLGSDEKRSHASLLEEMAARDPVFREHHSRLQAYRALRNALVHVSWDGGQTEPIAEPADAVLENYRVLVRYVLEPPRALESIATRDIFVCAWSTPIREGLGFIEARGYDTIPIVESGRLVGIYTQAALQRWLFRNVSEPASPALNATATFESLRSELAFDPDDATNSRDSPRLVELAPATASVEDLEHQFRAAATGGRFLVCVCMTESGHAFSPLLGLVTAHNLPSANAHAREVRLLRARAQR